MIHEIPQETVRRLGSTQVITDPITVIKELVENALDANATSISIESSPDLLSHIQVKDNGCGIPLIDRPLMAKPHCTSKIITFDDLSEVRTLGFRGEALASLANVCERLTIVTRVENESVGVSCDIARDGTISTTSPTSTPIGCTVRVANLFANFPVRKGALEKSAAKFLSQIEPLLFSYYLTHPKTRFNFKCVAGSKPNLKVKKIDQKYDVTLSASDKKEQAVLKCFGSEATRQGTWIYSSDFEHSQSSQVQFEAFVIKADADPKKVSKKGVCIAYKDRPLSVSRPRGLASSIYGYYKKRIKAHYTGQMLEPPTEPLIYFNIISSIGKVDVNIEPAKDDVLFTHAEDVMHNIEEAFCRFYAENAIQKQNNTRAQDFDRTISRNIGLSTELRSEITDDSRVLSETTSPATSSTPRKQFQSHISSTPCPSSSPIRINSAIANSEESVFISDEETDENEDSINIGQSDHPDSHAEPQTESDTADRNSEPRAKSFKWNTSMYGSGLDEDEEDLVDIDQLIDDGKRYQVAKVIQEKQGHSGNNPWIISKMNANIPRDKPETLPSKTGQTILGFEYRIPPSARSQGERQEASSPLPTPQPYKPQGSSQKKKLRRITGPMDNWASSARGQRENSSGSPTASIEDDGSTEDLSPNPSFFFGKPDLRMSNTQGDGGRGLFPSAGDRMNRQSRQQAYEDELDDDISFSEDEQILQSIPAKPRNMNSVPLKHTQKTKEERSKHNSALNQPFKPPKRAHTKGVHGRVTVPRNHPSITIPIMDTVSLSFRNRLVKESLYDDEYDSRPPLNTTAELGDIFLKYLRRQILNTDYSRDTELQDLQDRILSRSVELAFNDIRPI